MNTAIATRAMEERKRVQAFELTLKRIAGAWARAGEGFSLQALKRYAPDANTLLQLAETRLNSTWKAARQDLSTESEFAAALSAWETENYKAISALKAVM